jgi:chromatin segregation and condensation protein Rec8/ScpA/Scc1 (kleisin family)
MRGSDRSRAVSEARVADRRQRVIVLISTTIISALSATAAVAGLLAYVYALHRTNQTAARDEALALAETRRQTVNELRWRVVALEHSHKQARRHYRSRVQELEEAVQQTQREAREQAYQAQRLYVLALEESLTQVREELEKRPPDVKGALVRIAELLTTEERQSPAK